MTLPHFPTGGEIADLAPELALPRVHWTRKVGSPLIVLALCLAVVLATFGAMLAIKSAGDSRIASLPPLTAAERAEDAAFRDLMQRAEIPVLLPNDVVETSPQDARAINEAVPFANVPNPAAHAYRFQGTAEEQERALACLAAAVWYEAGDDPQGQRSVAQVVLNRVRHPAFPHTVCGVVFQGSDRATGCQFTFTCDGALSRQPGAAAWVRAMATARQMLGGLVDVRVGLATHYHTDWVVPVWSKELDKVAQVGTHLFFKWRGDWGRAYAYRAAYAGPEPVVTRIGFLSTAHLDPKLALAVDGKAEAGELDPNTIESGRATSDGRGMLSPSAVAALEPGIEKVNLRGNVLRLVHPQGGAYALQLNPAAPSGSFAMVALDLCRGKSYCKVMGWTDPSGLPARFPIPPSSQGSMAFQYVRDSRTRQELVQWDCAQFKRPDPAQCLGGGAKWDTLGGGAANDKDGAAAAGTP